MDEVEEEHLENEESLETIGEIEPKAAKAEVVTKAPSSEEKPPDDPVGPILEARDAWRDLEGCLDLGLTEGESPGTLDSWLGGLRVTLGEPVLQTEDWSEVEIETPAGEIRRIHVGMDYSGDDRIVRRLSYEKFLPDGAREMIPLDPELSVDPSDTILASLETDGEVRKRQRFQRIYFENGEEILAREQGGVVVDLEVNRGGRQFRCTGIGESGRCECIRAPEPPSDEPY